MKRKATSQKKRGYSKKRTTYNRPSIRRAPNVSARTGQGTMIRVNMPYVEKVTMPVASLGAASVYQYRLNSIFDPNLTGVGHQPGAHDQYAQLFETYTVTGCAYKVSFASDADSPKIVGVYISDREDTSTDITTMIEQGSCDWKHVSGQDGGIACAMFSGYVSLPKLMGLDYQNYISNPSYQTVFGSNPTDIGYLTLIAADSASASLGTVNTLIELTYYVRLQGTRLIPQS